MSGQEFGHGDNFPGLAKMRLFQEKMVWARLQELNSKSFEFNSNCLNKKQDLEVSKNVENLGGGSIKRDKNCWQSLEVKLEAEEAWN